MPKTPDYEKLDNELDRLMNWIGRLCGDSWCNECAKAHSLARQLHDDPPPVDGCRCSYCREARRLMKETSQ